MVRVVRTVKGGQGSPGGQGGSGGPHGSCVPGGPGDQFGPGGQCDEDGRPGWCAFRKLMVYMVLTTKVLRKVQMSRL